MRALQALGLGHVADLAKRCTEEAVNVLRTVMLNEKAADSARVAASIALLDRGWGRAPQSVELKHTTHIDVVYRSEEDFRQALIAQGVPAHFLPPPLEIEALPPSANNIFGEG